MVGGDRRGSKQADLAPLFARIEAIGAGSRTGASAAHDTRRGERRVHRDVEARSDARRLVGADARAAGRPCGVAPRAECVGSGPSASAAGA
jgi:hypothetical protein